MEWWAQRPAMRSRVALVERVVGGAHVGPLGLAALGRDHLRREHRRLRRHRHVRAVGVPALVAPHHLHHGVVGRHDRAGLLDGRDRHGVVALEQHLDRPEAPRERDLLVGRRGAGRGTRARRGGGRPPRSRPTRRRRAGRARRRSRRRRASRGAVKSHGRSLPCRWRAVLTRAVRRKVRRASGRGTRRAAGSSTPRPAPPARARTGPAEYRATRSSGSPPGRQPRRARAARRAGR